MQELTKQEIQAKMQKWKTLQQTIQGFDNEVLRERQHRQFTKLFGVYTPAEYQIGAIVRFRDDVGRLRCGEVLWSYGPGTTPVSGVHHPLTYLVDDGRGFPSLVHSPEIVAGQE